MTKYADATTVKQRSGVDRNDLGLTSSEFDALIATLNEQASDAIEDYCQRDFEDHPNETITIDGNGRDSIRLPGYPVRSISTVKVGENNPTTVDSSDYRVRDNPALPGDNGGVLERKHAIWPQGWENIEVTYTWGFTDPPNAVEQVADELVISALQSAAKDNKASGAKSISLDGFSVTFDPEALRMSIDELQRKTLNGHKRVIVA